MDKEEFAEVVVDATDSLFRVSYGILGNEVDCEDAVGEAIAIAFSKLYTLRQEKYAKTWLTKILIRECYRILKLRKHSVLTSEGMDIVIENSNKYDCQDYYELYEALEKLSKEQRTVIILYYLEGYSVKEIAKIIGVTQGTVKSRLSRARNNLRDILDQEKAASGDNMTRKMNKTRLDTSSVSVLN